MENWRPRVLIVDDERHIVDFVAMGLEGMEVEGALDGREALLVVEKFRPDVICWTSCYPISRGSRSELRADDYLGNSNVVEAYVSYLRRKLNGSGEPDLIETVRGAGCRLGG